VRIETANCLSNFTWNARRKKQFISLTLNFIKKIPEFPSYEFCYISSFIYFITFLSPKNYFHSLNIFYFINTFGGMRLFDMPPRIDARVVQIISTG
jgi:hypothetical protein